MGLHEDTDLMGRASAL